MALIQHIYQSKDHFCDYNRAIFRQLKEEFQDLEVKEIDMMTEGGAGAGVKIRRNGLARHCY